MFEGLFQVKYVNFKTSFVYLSPAHNQVQTGNYLRLLYQNPVTKRSKTLFFSVAIVNSLELEEIGINSVCARALELPEKAYVHVSIVEHLPVANNISITPKNQNDYEVLEILSQNVQSSLLDQVRVVNTKQPLTIWIGNSISVIVSVDDVRPISPGVLDFLTELTIKTPNNEPVASTSSDNSGKRPKLAEAPGKIAENFAKFIKENPNRTNIENIYAFLFSDQGFPFRVVPLANIRHSEKCSKSVLFNSVVYIMWHSRDVFQDGVYSLTALNSSHSRQIAYVQVKYLADYCVDRLLRENMYDIIVPHGILKALDLEFGSRVVLQKVNAILPVTDIQIKTRSNHTNEVIKKFTTCVQSFEEAGPILLNADLPFRLNQEVWVSLKFLPESTQFFLTNKENFGQPKISAVEDNTVRHVDEEMTNELNDSSLFQHTKLHKDTLSMMVQHAFKMENLIIAGKTGTGKTDLLKLAGVFFPFYYKHFYVQTVHCKALKGKTVESLQKTFSDIAQKLVSCQPSVLLLDDLHVLCENCEGDETPNSVYFNRVSEMLFNMFQQLNKNNAVCVLATVESREKLNKNLYTARGEYLFKGFRQIDSLTKDDREMILKHYFTKRETEDLDFSDLATKTDGYVIQDIVDFYMKAVYEAYKQEKDPKKIPIVTREHCELALEKMTPLSLQNVTFADTRYKSFSDIGGLRDVKSVLIESMMWPSQYPDIFSSCPLRLQSGILLYGPPGTGKTILAGAAAKYCDLRLISVKGPELLSKYIGASEQAVRDVFEKAQNAKPCILFFDEFDSLAPRRGHDNTGVTDRVVNQLLTQLDGVEALSDVFVLAATSRPDLLDPALLRPGRLDKQLFCPLPDQTAREEILKILTKGMELDDDVNFEVLATVTEGFTGADLQSVIYTAQMSVVTDMDFEEEGERDELLRTLKERFCPNTPKHFLSASAKKQLLEQTNADMLQHYRSKGGLLVFIIMETQEMRMVMVNSPRPVEVRSFLQHVKINVAPDTPIEIYDFNNWSFHEPHYAIFVGNCKPDVNLETIDNRCLIDAVHRTRCSLPLGERRRYDEIYTQFRTGIKVEAGAKVTLA